MYGLNQQRVLVLGLGESGLACVRWCAAAGAQVTVLDTRDQPPGLAMLQSIDPAIHCVKTLNADQWQSFDRYVCSPGLAPSSEPMRNAHEAAMAKGLKLESEIELFAQALHSLANDQHYKPKVIGITGTNGKTTTTSLTRLLVERCGVSVRMAGNISPAALDALTDAIQNDGLPHVWVLELSSFQLHTTHSLVCDTATVLNVTQDHLDWHGDMQSYADAKAQIFAPSTIRVLNRADTYCMGMQAEGLTHTFGLDRPEQANQYGLTRESGLAWLSVAEPVAHEGGRRKKGEPQPFMVKSLMPSDALQIRGLHNAANALAALALCRAIELPMAKLLHGLREYRGEPHRVEWVAQIDGVDYFDDSKGTNVGATVAALEGLGKTVVLIAGGDGKGQDFMPLLSPVKQYARAVALIGKDAQCIADALKDSAVPTQIFQTLEQATQAASQWAQANEAVLLSPACASLDMFKNYAHRAQVFVDTVREIAMDKGQPC